MYGNKFQDTRLPNKPRISPRSYKQNSKSIAAENRSSPVEYVQQIVESYIDHDACFRQKVAARVGEPDRGEFLTHEEVGTKVENADTLAAIDGGI